MATKVVKKQHKIKVLKKRIKELTKENEQLKEIQKKDLKDFLKVLDRLDESSSRGMKKSDIVFSSFEMIAALEKTILSSQKQLVEIYNHLNKIYD